MSGVILIMILKALAMMKCKCREFFLGMLKVKCIKNYLFANNRETEAYIAEGWSKMAEKIATPQPLLMAKWTILSQ